MPRLKILVVAVATPERDVDEVPKLTVLAPAHELLTTQDTCERSGEVGGAGGGAWACWG